MPARGDRLTFADRRVREAEGAAGAVAGILAGLPDDALPAAPGRAWRVSSAFARPVIRVSTRPATARSSAGMPS
ncbi:hypothetical protein ACFV1W_37390 [Kitasatospora sp. NPDC059648]|uniref:hypothetical protein n=1 Tax=Kitasatospora sp. NPDC059648 TaxID=3346894 RepID=UPI00367427BA